MIKALKISIKGIAIIITIIFGCIALIKAVFLYQSIKTPHKLPSIFGYTAVTVLSDSMSPLMKSGDLAILKKIQTKDVQINDIISYTVENNIQLIDRVENIQIKNGRVFLKLKNRQATEEQLSGKYVFMIPFAGKIKNFTSTTHGVLTIVLLPALIIIEAERRTKKVSKSKDLVMMIVPWFVISILILSNMYLNSSTEVKAAYLCQDESNDDYVYIVYPGNNEILSLVVANKTNRPVKISSIKLYAEIAKDNNIISMKKEEAERYMNNMMIKMQYRNSTGDKIHPIFEGSFKELDRGIDPEITIGGNDFIDLVYTVYEAGDKVSYTSYVNSAIRIITETR